MDTTPILGMLVILAAGPSAEQELEEDAISAEIAEPAFVASFSGGGFVEGDLRIAVPDDGEEAFVERSRSIAGFRFEAKPAPRVRGLLDGRVLWLGEPRVSSQEDLSDRSRLDPVRVDVDAAFVEVSGLPAGVRLRAGRQTIRWGSGLLFNPTSLVSPPDLEDPLRFGEPIGNEMVRLDALLGPLHLEAVAVPRFRPALLPPVSDRDLLLASGDPNAQAIAEDESWTVDLDVDTTPPSAAVRHAQGALRMSGSIASFDAAVSWYHGRTPLPQLKRGDFTADFAARTLTGTARADYPVFDALGADLAGEVLGFGVWAEAALLAPLARDTVVNVTAGGVTQTERRRELTDRYVRAAVGVDRRTEGNLWVAAQWVRGFVDEFGADEQGDYVFLFAERPFFRERLRIRLVGGAAVEDGSVLLAPEVAFLPADAVSLSLAGYAGIGDDDTKFGRPLTGPPVVIGRARLYF